MNDNITNGIDYANYHNNSDYDYVADTADDANDDNNDIGMF